MTSGNKHHAEAIRTECRAFLEGKLQLTLNMDKTHITHVNDGFVFLGHRIIRKRGPRGTMRPVSTIPREKARAFVHKLTAQLSGHDHVNKIDQVEAINRQLAGWANFYQYTDYTAMVYRHVDHVVFWKLAHWLARKYKTSIRSLMRQWIRRPSPEQAKTWQLWGRSGNGNLCGIALRRLVTSRKQRFYWRTPAGNPHLAEYRNRRATTSGYRDVVLALSHA